MQYIRVGCLLFLRHMVQSEALYTQEKTGAWSYLEVPLLWSPYPNLSEQQEKLNPISTHLGPDQIQVHGLLTHPPLICM